MILQCFLRAILCTLTQASVTMAWQASYLDSLQAAPAHVSRSTSPAETADLASQEEIPDEWYGKERPMASWQGWKHPQWGGYVDHLSLQKEDCPNDTTTFAAGKQANYGNDVRWGAQVYLNAL